MLRIHIARSTLRWLLLAVLGPLAFAGAVLAAQFGGDRSDPEAPAADRPTAVKDPDIYCAGVARHYGIHGTDCKSLPIVTAPGALGPANTGGPGGGTDWEPAFPGSNVWIPDYQISGRLVIVPPGTAPPPGYENLGRTPDGAALYWRPFDYPITDTKSPMT